MCPLTHWFVRKPLLVLSYFHWFFISCASACMHLNLSWLHRDNPNYTQNCRWVFTRTFCWKVYFLISTRNNFPGTAYNYLCPFHGHVMWVVQLPHDVSPPVLCSVISTEELQSTVEIMVFLCAWPCILHAWTSVYFYYSYSQRWSPTSFLVMLWFSIVLPKYCIITALISSMLVLRPLNILCKQSAASFPDFTSFAVNPHQSHNSHFKITFFLCYSSCILPVNSHLVQLCLYFFTYHFTKTEKNEI